MIEPARLQQIDVNSVLYKGRKLVFFAGCDYFRMTSRPVVRRALRRSLQEIGLSVAASRITTGNHEIYADLEKAIAKFFAAPSATLVQAGYMTNMVVVQALAGQCSDVLMDESAHPSLRDAAKFAECPTHAFPSRNPEGLRAALKRCAAKRDFRPLIMTDGMFSRDGTVAPLREYLEVAPRSSVFLIDDAHGAGVLGKHGRGALEQCGVNRDRIIQTVTLSKAFGVYGGAILGSLKLREKIFEHSRMFAGSTPLPLPLAGAALASIEFVAAHPELRVRLMENAERVRAPLRARGFDVPNNPGPLMAFAARDASTAKRVTQALVEAGVYPSLSRYPGTPKGGLLRFVISSEHTKVQLDALRSALEQFTPSDLFAAR